MLVTKSISAPLDRKATSNKATRQLQSHWIRNKHQSLTNSQQPTATKTPFFTILTLNTGYRTLNIMRKQ
jgi:hypothetical protein